MKYPDKLFSLFRVSRNGGTIRVYWDSGFLYILGSDVYFQCCIAQLEHNIGMMKYSIIFFIYLSLIIFLLIVVGDALFQETVLQSLIACVFFSIFYIKTLSKLFFYKYNLGIY